MLSPKHLYLCLNPCPLNSPAIQVKPGAEDLFPKYLSHLHAEGKHWYRRGGKHPGRNTGSRAQGTVGVGGDADGSASFHPWQQFWANPGCAEIQQGPDLAEGLGMSPVLKPLSPALSSAPVVLGGQILQTWKSGSELLADFLCSCTLLCSTGM